MTAASAHRGGGGSHAALETAMDARHTPAVTHTLTLMKAASTIQAWNGSLFVRGTAASYGACEVVSSATR